MFDIEPFNEAEDRVRRAEGVREGEEEPADLEHEDGADRGVLGGEGPRPWTRITNIECNEYFSQISEFSAIF